MNTFCSKYKAKLKLSLSTANTFISSHESEVKNEKKRLENFKKKEKTYKTWLYCHSLEWPLPWNNFLAIMILVMWTVTKISNQ